MSTDNSITNIQRSGNAELDKELELLREQVDQLERRLKEVRALFWDEPSSPEAAAFRIEEQQVRRLIKVRRVREKHLGDDLFADPAWDILLEALAVELGNKRISVSGLCYSSSVPPTTALRWVRKLEEEGWLLRVADPFDARRQWMELTPEGSERIRSYFAVIGPSLFTS